MRYQLYREHKYVSAALNDLERLIARTDFCNSTSVKTLEHSLVELTQMLQGHAQYENERLHLLLKQKASPIFHQTHVEEDHAVQDQRLLEIQELLQKILKEGEPEEKMAMGHRLYLSYRKFVADNLAHLHEEETCILPELQRLYSDHELQQIVAQTYREMSPEQMVHMLETLAPHMNPYDLRAFLCDIQELEPEKFEIVWQAMRKTLDDVDLNFSGVAMKIPVEKIRPRVGVGVFVFREGKILLGKRKGAHGVGDWAPPGGHLEYGESVEECAKRELLEETSLKALSIRTGTWSNDVMDGNKHYVTLFAMVDQFEGEVQLLEPNKCEEWHWFSTDALPSPLFPPVVSFFQQLKTTTEAKIWK